jgi:hypothetical protein
MSACESIRNVLRNSPELAIKLVDFNWNLATNVHPAQRQKWLPEIPDAVWHEPRISGRISNLLLNRVGLSEEIFPEALTSMWLVALLPAERLHRLVLHIGALILGIRIRASLSREHVIAWKMKLGDEAYRFAMSSAALLPVGRFPLKAIATDAADELGASVVMTALVNDPPLLRERIALKFSKEISVIDMDTESAAKISLMVARILEREWFSSLAVPRR